MGRLAFPSYMNGFARNAAESANPNLWDGLVGGWAPTLGVTGATLRDQSSLKNHGPLSTSMDPSTDWIINRNGHALGFDGINDWVFTPVVNHNIGTGDFTWVIQLIPVNITGASYQGIAANGLFLPGLYTLVHSGQWGAHWGGDRLSGNALSIGQTYSLVMRRKSGIIAFWQNGIKTPTEHSVATSMANEIMRIGTSNGAANESTIDLSSMLNFARALSVNEIQQLYVDPHALFRLKSRTYFVPAVPGGLSIPVAMHHYTKNIQAA